MSNPANPKDHSDDTFEIGDRSSVSRGRGGKRSGLVPEVAAAVRDDVPQRPPNGLVNDLAVNRDTTLQFSRMLLEAGASAWQRWQAVRTLECYPNLVLDRSEPDLSSIIAKLAQMGQARMQP